MAGQFIAVRGDGGNRRPATWSPHATPHSTASTATAPTVLVTFEEGAEPDLFGLSHLARELGDLFGRKVDVLTRRGVEGSRNPYRRRGIQRTAETLYAA